MKITEKQKDDHDFVCGHCQKAKHSKHSFKSSGIRSSAPLEIIFSDICDPFPVSPDRTIWNPTTTYTPQENGVSERLNRTLLSKLRAMLSDLKNMAPAKLLGETPYEKSNGTKPDLSHLRTIGTTA